MVETQFPKFRWGMTSEPNAGHTQDEWGIKKATKKVIVAYTVAWDKISEEYQYYKVP